MQHTLVSLLLECQRLILIMEEIVFFELHDLSVTQPRFLQKLHRERILQASLVRYFLSEG